MVFTLGHIITDGGTVEHGVCRFDPWLLTAVAIHNTDSAGAAVYAVHERVDERSTNPLKKIESPEYNRGNERRRKQDNRICCKENGERERERERETGGRRRGNESLAD